MDRKDKIPFRPRFKSAKKERDYENSPNYEWEEVRKNLEKKESRGESYSADVSARGRERSGAGFRRRADCREEDCLLCCSEDNQKRSGKPGGRQRFLVVLLIVAAMTASAEAAEKYGIDVPAPGLFKGNGSGRESTVIVRDIAVEVLKTAKPPEDAGDNDYVDEVGAAEDEPDSQTTGEAAELIEYDINYSQSDRSFSADGIDVLMKVKNNNEEAIGCVDFTVSVGDELISDVNNGGTTFVSTGYIGPGEEGFMYSKIYIDDNSPRKQGRLEITDASFCRLPDGYKIPTGQVTSFDPASDTYDVKVLNENEEPVNAAEAYIIAVQRDYADLPGSWGAGSLRSNIKPGEEMTIKKAIYNPGFDSYETSRYDVFVIDRSVVKPQNSETRGN